MLGLAEGEGDGLADGVGVGVCEGEAEGVGVGVAVGVALGFTEGLGVVLTVGFSVTEALAEGDGDGLGSGVGVGVALGEGELVSPKTSGEDGRKIDFKKSPDPMTITSKTPESIIVGLEGFCNIPIINYTLTPKPILKSYITYRSAFITHQKDPQGQ